MDHRLQLELRGRNPVQVKELTLDNCRPAQNGANGNVISEKLADFVNLEALRMINTGLTSLKGFPRLPCLKKLDISDNRLTGGLNYIAEACPGLESLNMGGNRIKDLESLEPLKNLSKLKHLDMFSCEIVAMENYREKVFELLPQLNDLDSFDRNNTEVFDEDEEEEEDDDEENEYENDSDEENLDREDVDDGSEASEEEEEEDSDEEDDEDDENGLPPGGENGYSESDTNESASRGEFVSGGKESRGVKRPHDGNEDDDGQPESKRI